MQVLYERCAAVDIGKDAIAVAVRLPADGPDGRATHKRTFKTFYGVLREAARWLNSLGVTHVAMEATGIYSMPVYYALIEHGKFEQVLVCTLATSRTSRAAKPWCGSSPAHGPYGGGATASHDARAQPFRLAEIGAGEIGNKAGSCFLHASPFNLICHSGHLIFRFRLIILSGSDRVCTAGD